MRFVVNKWDLESTAMGQDEAKTKKHVANLVNEQLSGEGFQLQLQPEQVCLADNAQLADQFSVCELIHSDLI